MCCRVKLIVKYCVKNFGWRPGEARHVILALNNPNPEALLVCLMRCDLVPSLIAEGSTLLPASWHELSRLRQLHQPMALRTRETLWMGETWKVMNRPRFEGFRTSNQVMLDIRRLGR